MMSKYKQSMGDPLDMLVEEASEVIKEVCKARRFGLAGNPVWVEAGNKPPIENIHQEIADFGVIVDILVARGIIDIEKIYTLKQEKREKLDRYFDDFRVDPSKATPRG